MDDHHSALLSNNNDIDRSFPINEECTSLGLYRDAFVLAGFSDGTIRIFDLLDSFALVVTAEEYSNQQTFVNSNLYQSYGAVACQIHAKGVHTNLRTELKVAGEYCFASVVRGSMECVAIQLDGLVCKKKHHDSTNILDAIDVTSHSDAKLRGLLHATKFNHDYLLLTGKSIQNLHVWRFAASHWTCLYDTATNGNTIQWSTVIGTSIVSKSEGQCVRVWNGIQNNDTTKLSHYDMLGTESAVAVATDWKLYSTGVFDPGHLRVHDFETDETTHLCMVPNSGRSRRHYASVERVMVLDGTVMVLVSDGSVWCGINDLVKIATGGATACHASEHLSVVATNETIQCRVLPWKKEEAVSMVAPLEKCVLETKKKQSDDEKSESTESLVPLHSADDTSKSKPNESLVPLKVPPGLDNRPKETKTKQSEKSQPTDSLVPLNPVDDTKESKPNDSLVPLNVQPSLTTDTARTKFDIRPKNERDEKRKRRVLKSSATKPKKKPRILLTNILTGSGSIKTPTHRPEPPIVSEIKTNGTAVPTMPLPMNVTETPCAQSANEPSPIIPRKRRDHHPITPRKLESPPTCDSEILIDGPVETSDTDATTALGKTTTHQPKKELLKDTGSIGKSKHSNVKKSNPEAPKAVPGKQSMSYHRTTAADRKQQMRVAMCRKQIRSIDKAVRQLTRTEENFVRSRILLLVRRVIQDILFDGSTVASQRAKLENVILPAFRRNIVIPWLLRCGLETQKPAKEFDESIFDQALGYLVAIELI